MILAVCFKCGSAKSDALGACRSCGAAPRTNSECVVSFALSNYLSSTEQLTQYSHELQKDEKLSLPRETLVQAEEALKAPEFSAVYGVRPSTPDSSSPAQIRQPPPIPTEASQRQARTQPLGKSCLTTTALHQSPFAVLGITTRDDRRRIVDLTEEKSLELDQDVCQKARSDLTSPRTRLNVEVAWLPGVSPRRASQMLQGLLFDPMAIREVSGLPTLAHLNLLAAAFEAVDSNHDAEDLVEFIKEIGYLAEDLAPGEVLRDINEDRVVSGFPEVHAQGHVETELAERKRYYRATIRNGLNRLPPTKLVQVMIDTVDGVTMGGEKHAPELIDDLVDSYELEAQEFLEKEAVNVHKIIQAARDVTNLGEAVVKPYVDMLHTVASNWDKVAQPIQLSAKARGTDHKASRDLAYEIRSLAIELFNKHNMLAQSQRLTALLQELFAEIPVVAELAEQDADILANIVKDRKQGFGK